MSPSNVLRESNGAASATHTHTHTNNNDQVHMCSDVTPNGNTCCNHLHHTRTPVVCEVDDKSPVRRTTSANSFQSRTHSLFTNCVLSPCPGDNFPRSKERLLRTQRHHKPSVIKNFSRTQILVLLTLALGDFISFCSMSIMAPFFPKEATEKGMGVSLSGFVFSFYALVMFIMAPIIGKVLPALGAKNLFMSGMFLAGFSNILFGFLPLIDDYVIFTTVCFLIRGLEAVGAGAFSTASFVFVVEVFPDNISTVLGILETFIGLGMSVGPAIGGILYSVGGFGLPFFVLGTVMILVVPFNYWFLPSFSGGKSETSSGSFWNLIKIPSVFIIGLIVVMSSNIWSFLDPTLEPHLRQLDLTSKEVGLVFLLFSSIYGVFSLIWGWLADKLDNHWGMMVVGQFCSVICLLALGPSPFITGKPNSLMINLISLSLLGICVALTLMPTFQALLRCALQNGHKKGLPTYSVIAGAWSCMYSLGEMIGPTLGGILLDKYDFPICSTVMAAGTLMVAVASLIYFSLQSTYMGTKDDDDDEEGEQRMPLLQEKRVYYKTIADDACIVFVPTAGSN
ncbi:MFS-type transporter SLC18B1 isoform X1 [Nilaparvata lugens]|uniref:MFS-type transporter SLC18B1 isoform X1 n=3 Tax=Nilaparvata lugens TaxID=108931 RepID=UPI00193D891E|nr:MFS-type transporter SLC18B1 isoform X1 [Nilaparvata lugens]